MYFFNYLIKIKKIKKLKLKKKSNFFFNHYNLENLHLKIKIYNFFFNPNQLNFYYTHKKNNFFIKFFKYFYLLKKNGNLNFLKKILFKGKTTKFVFNNNNIYTNFFCFFNYKIDLLIFFFNINVFSINIFFNINAFFFFNVFKNLNKIRALKSNNKKKLRRKKRFFFKRTKFFKLKKKYRYKLRYLYFNKLNIKKNKSLLDRNMYKLIMFNIINNFKINFSFFNFYSLNKYNFYLFIILKNQKKYFKNFFRKKLFFFDFLKKKNNNLNLIYNNQYPIYNSNKILLKNFRKIFKSVFNKKFNNYLYYYLVPLFEYIFNKNIFINFINSSIFKKPKLKKKFFVRKLIKIYKKNRFSVLSRSITFNLYEIIEIILYSFYYKDVFLLSNWFLKNFKNVHFTNHKKFLVFFKTIINDIFESYRDILQIKGFYFIIKGKVGVTSNAKKKTIKFIIGSSNKSKKSQKMDFQQGVVKSLSGSLGVSMILTY